MFDFLKGLTRPKSKRRRLLIYDDLFPVLASGFRVAEYNAYLEAFPDAKVLTTMAALPFIHDTRSYETLAEEYLGTFPENHGRFELFDDSKFDAGCFAYTIFLHNTHRVLPILEAKKIPFAFTLYPGGGFALNDETSDSRLDDILKSPMLRHIIVTQKVTRDYLKSRKFPLDKTTMIPGGPLHSEILKPLAKERFPFDKATLDIAFVANRYVPRGVDKGYDVFIEMARIVIEQRDDVRFHIVGPWVPEDVEMGDIADRVTFYGTRATPFFADFYQDIDAIVSPNGASLLRPGGFDGFPTGCCVEAGHCGAAIFCTDPLSNNLILRDGIDFVEITRDPVEVAQQLLAFLDQPQRLYELAENGCRTIIDAYSPQKQLAPRVALLRRLIAEG